MHADVRLEGHLHIGDETAAEFTPADPLACERYAAFPSHFVLSQDLTVTALTLHDAVDLDAPLTPEFDGRRYAANCADCTACDGTASCGDITVTLATPLTLNRGPHTLALLDASGDNGACQITNDYGFSGVTLISDGSSTHRMFSQRRHLGDRDDADDDYDLAGDFQMYPDAPEGTSLTLPFTLEAGRWLAEARLMRVRGNEATSPPARLRVDGTVVGSIAGNGSVLIPGGQWLAAGAHTVTITSGAVGSNPDDFSWDDLILLLTPDPLMSPGAFNAVDPGQDAASGRIGTKVAGTAFLLDLVALGGDGAPLMGYTGNVTVQLLDARESTGVLDTHGCDIGWTVADPNFGAATFTVPDSGRKSISASYADALRIARVRVHDPVLGVSGCSTDAFAIRPVAFANTQASHNDSRTAGTAQALAGGGFSGTTPQTHRAGRPFTLRTGAVNSLGAVVAGYDGAPTLRAAASVLGPHAGGVASSAWGGAGTVRSDNVRYFEAGAARLELTDTTFADIDAGDTAAASRRIGPTAFEVGRFIPDHFRFAPLAAEFLPACGGFTYAGQPLAFSLAPTADIQAAGFGGAPVRNYTDPALYKLPAAIGPATYSAFNAGVVYVPPAPDNDVAPQADGLSRITLRPLPPGALAVQRAAPTAPFAADIAITLGPTNEADGVEFEVLPPRFGNALAGEGVPFLAGNNQMRFGRLVLDNAHGSELLDLPLPLRTEYWTAEGFTPALDDSCTALADTQFVINPDPVALPTGVDGAPLTVPLANGRASLPLTAPNSTGTAAVRADLTAALLTWLRGDWDGDGDYNEPDVSGDPSARATFGIFRGNDRRIYQREVVR